MIPAPATTRATSRSTPVLVTMSAGEAGTDGCTHLRKPFETGALDAALRLAIPPPTA